MTEKQFILVEYVNKGLFIQDNANGETQYFQGSKASLEKVVDLLNSLNDENEQLRKDATTLIYANQDYRHENEQLREQLEDANELNKIYVDFMVDNGFELSDVVEWSKKDI